MIGRVPMVEPFPVIFIGYLGAHHKTAFGHRVLPVRSAWSRLYRVAKPRAGTYRILLSLHSSAYFSRYGTRMPADAHISQDATNCLSTAMVVLQSCEGSSGGDLNEERESDGV
jgi:hypothetical protein